MAIYTIDQTLQVNDYYANVIKAVAYDRPLQATLKRGPVPENWEQKIEVEGKVKTFNMAAPEGGDFNEAGLTGRKNAMMTCQLQKFRSQRGYSVTRETSMLPGYTQKKGEKELARQQRMDAEELTLSIERALGSNQEAVERGTGATVPYTRGILNWLKKGGAHQVHPIPDVVKPGCGISGDISSASVFSEDIFKAELVKAALEQGDSRLALVGYCGLQLKLIMSNWLGRATTVSGMDNIIRRTEPKAKSIELICDEFTWDGVTARTLVDNHLNCTIGNVGAEIVQGTKSFYTGAFIRPEFWTIDTLEPLTAYDLEDKGAGPRGYHEAILRLACRNPLGQFAVIDTTVDASSSSSSSSSGEANA